MAKTKAELELELEDARKKIAEDKKEIERCKKALEKANTTESLDDATQLIKEFYDSFIRSGFTDEQAFRLTEITVTNVAKKPTLF